MMPEAEIVHASGLSDDDASAWTSIQAATPAFASPLLGPEFARAVGEVREDARVAIWRRDGRPVGFLAHHRRPGGFARPIGAPLSDYHALVAEPGLGLDAASALTSADLSAFRFSGLLDPHGVFKSASDVRAASVGLRIRLTGSAEEHLQRLAETSGNRLRNVRRYRRKLEAAFGPIRLVEDRDPAAFHRLLHWKRVHLQCSGLHDFLQPQWAAALLERLFERSDRGFGGLMLSLYAGDRHLAGHFGVRQGGHYHPWIGAMDRDLESYSPGSVHQWEAVAAMDRLGLDVYDLGPGSDHWKRLFASESISLTGGLATARGLGGDLARMSERVWAAPPLSRLELAHRMRNRLDQIAAMEPTAGGRIRGVLDAATGFGRREATRRRPAAV